MTLPGLVATDLDGTLLRGDFTVSDRTRAALTALGDAGIPVVIATGRPVRWMPMVYALLPAAFPTVCANGAALYDPIADALVSTTPMSPEVLGEVCARLMRVLPNVCFAAEVDGGRRMVRQREFPLRWFNDHALVTIAELPELISSPAVKLLVRAGARESDEFAALIAFHLADLVETTHSSRRSGLVELSAYGVTKATGLAAVSQRLGVASSDVVAFGDMPNDVPMLRWAGRGVAVANAHEIARDAADAVTLSNDDDGVAVYLERLLAD